MTQSLQFTKLNNLEDMLLKAKQISGSDFSGADKSVCDFKKIFDKTIDKTKDATKGTTIDKIFNNVAKKVDELASVLDKQGATNNEAIENIENVEMTEGLATQNLCVEEIKKLYASLDVESNWAEFKDILSEIIKETNAETSLDLTLAKDIADIINQLKESVENAEEIVENVLEQVVVQEEQLVPDLQEEVSADIGNKEVVANNDIPLEKLLVSLNSASVDCAVEPKLDKELMDGLSNEVDNAFDLLENSQLDLVELTEENITDAVITTKQAMIPEAETEESELVLEEDLLKELNIESIKSEVDSSNSEGFMQPQTPEEIAVKACINKDVEAFELNLDTTPNIQNQPQVQQPKVVDVNPSRILDQISKQLGNLQNNSKVSIVLNPESLGKVDIQLMTTKDGLSAQFTVATQEARDLLMKGLEGLKESLVSHGVGVDNVSVKVAEGQKSEYKQDWTEQDGSRGGNKKQDQHNREEKEKGLFEKMMAQSQEENGNV